MTAGVWHHVAFLFNGSESRMYIDGELKHTMETTFSGGSTTFALGIGIGRTRHMNGAIAENILSAGSFSEQEVSMLYDFGKWRKQL